MMAADTTTQAPTLDLFDGTGITGAEDLGQLEDLGYPDAVDETVGRSGYLSNWTEDECLLTSENDAGGEAAEFDRYYFPTDDEAHVLVDMLSGGSTVEIANQEADRMVALKREWCEARGVKYIVWIDPLLQNFS